MHIGRSSAVRARRPCRPAWPGAAASGSPLRASAAWACVAQLANCGVAPLRAPAPRRRSACSGARPCRRSCPACPRPASRRGCRRRPGTPGRSRRRSRTARSRPVASAMCRRPRPSARWPAAARRSCGGACRAARARRAATPMLARSIAWPPAMPAWPALRASSAHSRACSAGATCAASSGVSTSKARACIASPASIAWASPKRTCTVGLPRRSTSLSMQGMSSWTSE